MELFIVTYQGGVVLAGTDCNHWKGTKMNILKLNLILEKEN